MVTQIFIQDWSYIQAVTTTDLTKADPNLDVIYNFLIGLSRPNRFRLGIHVLLDTRFSQARKMSRIRRRKKVYSLKKA